MLGEDATEIEARRMVQLLRQRGYDAEFRKHYQGSDLKIEIPQLVWHGCLAQVYGEEERGLKLLSSDSRIPEEERQFLRYQQNRYRVKKYQRRLRVLWAIPGLACAVIGFILLLSGNSYWWASIPLFVLAVFFWLLYIRT